MFCHRKEESQIDNLKEQIARLKQEVSERDQESTDAKRLQRENVKLKLQIKDLESDNAQKVVSLMKLEAYVEGIKDGRKDKHANHRRRSRSRSSSPSSSSSSSSSSPKHRRHHKHKHKHK